MEGTFNTEDEATEYVRIATYGTWRKVSSLEEVTETPRHAFKTFKATFADGTTWLWYIRKAREKFTVDRLPPRDESYMPED